MEMRQMSDTAFWVLQTYAIWAILVRIAMYRMAHFTPGKPRKFVYTRAFLLVWTLLGPLLGVFLAWSWGSVPYAIFQLQVLVSGWLEIKRGIAQRKADQLAELQAKSAPPPRVSYAPLDIKSFDTSTSPEMQKVFERAVATGRIRHDKATRESGREGES